MFEDDFNDCPGCPECGENYNCQCYGQITESVEINDYSHWNEEAGIIARMEGSY
jgi:hypothetical protein